MRESNIMRLVRVAASKLGIINFRNSVGFAMEPDGTPIRYGLCVGSSDIIGFKKHLVRERDVGTYIAVFTAIECKSATGKLTREQLNFLTAVEDAGGIAIVARCEQDVERGITAWTNMDT